MGGRQTNVSGAAAERLHTRTHVHCLIDDADLSVDSDRDQGKVGGGRESSEWVRYLVVLSSALTPKHALSVLRNAASTMRHCCFSDVAGAEMLETVRVVITQCRWPWLQKRSPQLLDCEEIGVSKDWRL